MELTKYQKLYLQTAYDYFRENAKWPTHRQIEAKILPTHEDFDVVEVARSLADPSHRSFITNDPTLLAILPIEQIRQCYGSEKDLENFVSTVCYCAEKYRFSTEAQVQVSSEEIHDKFRLLPLSIQKIGWLFCFSTIFSSINGDADYKQWTITLSHDIISFRGIRTIDDYLATCDKRNKSFFEPAENPLLNAVPIIDPAPLIEKVAQTDPTDIQATTAALMKIDNVYYVNALRQSQRSFYCAIIMGILGFILLAIATLNIILRHPDNAYLLGPIIANMSGAIVEVIAGIFLVIHRRSSDQANQCHERLNRLQRFLVAVSHCEKLEGDLKNTTRAELIKRIGDLQ